MKYFLIMYYFKILTYELVSDPDAVGQTWRRDDETIDESHQRCLVVGRGGIFQLFDDNI